MRLRPVITTVLGIVPLGACGRDAPAWTCVAIGASTVCGTSEGGELGVRAGRLAAGHELRSSSDGVRTIVWTGPIAGADSSRGPGGPAATFSLSPTGEVLVEVSP